jgi:hypothetical protein
MSFSKKFEDKTVIITGASAGFGASMAEAFAQQGARLILIARRKERLEVLKEKLNSLYQTEVLNLNIDVSNHEDVKKQLSDLPEPFAAPDILINNAGLVKGLNKVWETSAEDWNEMIDINVKGLLSVTAEIIPKMLAKNQGHIINIGSISGFDTYVGGGVYCATKFAVTAITETLRKELVATPIRVSLVAPGMAETEFSLVRFSGDKNKADSVYQNIEALKPEDIAEIVLFMASRPPHVNISDVVVYPTNQASVSLVHRKGS